MINIYQIAYIAKLIVFLSLYRLLFPEALEQNLTLSQESLLIFHIPNESIISELKVNTQMQCVLPVQQETKQLFSIKKK